MSTRLKPGIPAPTPASADIDQFVRAAPRKADYPWQGSFGPVMPEAQLNVRMRLDIMLMMDYLHYHTNVPKREIAERALRAYFASEAKRLGIPPLTNDTQPT
jgi:hypothetical protein